MSVLDTAEIDFIASQTVLKGSVQRKLRGVRNSNNLWLLAWDQGTEHFFCHIKSLHIVQNNVADPDLDPDPDP